MTKRRPGSQIRRRGPDETNRCVVAVRALLERAALNDEGSSVAALAAVAGYAEASVAHAIGCLRRAGVIEYVPRPKAWRLCASGALVRLTRGGRPKLASAARRRCLGCAKSFASAWIGNRLCPSCAGRGASSAKRSRNTSSASRSRSQMSAARSRGAA